MIERQRGGGDESRAARVVELTLQSLHDLISAVVEQKLKHTAWPGNRPQQRDPKTEWVTRTSAKTHSHMPNSLQSNEAHVRQGGQKTALTVRERKRERGDRGRVCEEQGQPPWTRSHLTRQGTPFSHTFYDLLMAVKMCLWIWIDPHCSATWKTRTSYTQRNAIESTTIDIPESVSQLFPLQVR